VLNEHIYKFAARNVSMSTFFGFNCARDGVLTSPALQHNHSGGELLAWITRNFRAADRAIGNQLCFSADLHLRQITGYVWYHLISFDKQSQGD
jgi:hypothetical protein